MRVRACVRAYVGEYEFDMWVGPPDDVFSVQSEPPRHNHLLKRFQFSFDSVDIIFRKYKFTKLCLIMLKGSVVIWTYEHRER
jgi:hypothetical protein